MSTAGVTDEMLMAYADGEIHGDEAGAVERAVAQHPLLAQRLERMKETRRLAREAFADIAARPVPAALARAILDHPTAGTPARRLHPPKVWLPLAAAILLIVGIGGFLAGGYFHDRSLLVADRAITSALEDVESGGTRAAGTQGRVSVLATYRLGDRVCRTFEVHADARAVKGIGCRNGAQWTIELAVAQSGPGSHAPASERATESIDAFLDGAGAEGPLDAEAERALRASGWIP